MAERPSAPRAATLAPRRITVASPRAQVDLSLPSQALVADVVSQLSSLLSGSRDPSNPGEAPAVDPSGWVLTTLIGATLDDEQTVAQAGIRDGDLLYLHPRTPALPEPLFDDVVDAVALTTGTRHRWDAGQTRVAALVAVASVAAAGLPVLVFAAPRGAAAVAAGSLAFLLIGAGVLFGRVLRQDRPSLVALALAVAYAALAGAAVLSAGPDPLALIAPPSLLLGGVLALAVTATGLFTAPGRGAEVAFGGVLAGGIVVLSAVMILFEVEPAHVAGVGAVVLALSAPSWPTLALRLGGVPMPLIPRDVSDFTELTSSDAARDSVDAAHQSGRHLSALLLGFGLIIAGCIGVVQAQGGAWATWLAIVLAIALISRSRHLRATANKLCALLVGGVAIVVVIAGLVRTGDPVLVVGLTVVAVVGAAVAALLIERMPVRRPSPHRARVLDVVEILALVALVPLLFGVLDLYVLLLGLGG